MAFQRRQLLRFTGTGLLLTALPALASAKDLSHLRAHKIRDDLALPLFKAGDIVVVDSASNGFDGAGLYLYPAWGKPRPYLVTGRPGGVLAFCNPGTGKLLWTQSHALDPAFAGKVVERAVPATAGTSALPFLRVGTMVPALAGRA